MQIPQNFRRVVENIYAGGACTPAQIEDLVKKYNIKYVLSLDETAGQMVQSTLQQLNVKQFIVPFYPIPYMSDSLRYLIRNIKNILTNQPIYIHCIHGQDRSGFIIALYRILKYNFNVQQALSEAKRYNYGLGVSVQTQQFWNKILTTLSTNKNPADVGATDDNLISLPYPSIPGEYPSDYPYTGSILQPEDRKLLLRKILEDENDLPLVGVYTNSIPHGIGPVEVSGLYLHLNG